MRKSSTATIGPAVKLGIFAVVTLAALALLTDALGGIRLPGGTKYRAEFSDVTGLLPGDDVRIAGVSVGEVDGIDLRQAEPGSDEPNLAIVTFVLDGDRDLPADVEATIRYRNLVGQRYVSLTNPGGGGTALLESGDTIGLDRTAPALDLTILLNGFRPLFQGLNPDEVNALTWEIIQVFQGEGATVSSLLSHTASLTNTLADQEATIDAVITNLTDVLNVVAERDDELDTSVARLEDFVTGLSEDRDAIGESIVAIGDLAIETEQLLEDARPPLAADVDALGDLATILNDNSEALETALTRLPVTYEALTRTGSYGSWFNFFLCDFDGQLVLPAVGTVNPATFSSPTARCQDG